MADGQPDSGYMMQLGDPITGSFTFQIGTAAYSKFTRTDAWRWVTQDRINNDPQEQFVGKGSTTFALEGVIFSSFNPGAGIAGSTTTAVGTKQLDVIRAIADSGAPQSLVDGRGNVFGQVVVVEIKEEAEAFLVNGAPQKQTFVITLRSYGKRKPVTLQNLVPFVASSTPTGVNQDFSDLAKTDLFAAQVASTLSNNGVGLTDAAKDGSATSALQKTYAANLTQADATTLAIDMGKNYGLTGKGFNNGLAFLPSVFSATKWDDKNSVLQTGLPDLNSVLENDLGVSGEAEAEAALGTFSVIPPDAGDRGVFLSNFASQLQDVLGLSADALDGTGIVTDRASMSSDTSTRFADLMGQLATLQTNNPSKFEELFPDGEYKELNEILAAQTSGALTSSMNNIQTAVTEVE